MLRQLSTCNFDVLGLPVVRPQRGLFDRSTAFRSWPPCDYPSHLRSAPADSASLETQRAQRHGNLESALTVMQPDGVQNAPAEIGLTGTKLGCGEGGCGACTVMVSNVADDGSLLHRSVNACLCPLYAVEGMHVVTVEGECHAANAVTQCMTILRACWSTELYSFVPSCRHRQRACGAAPGTGAPGAGARQPVRLLHAGLCDEHVQPAALKDGGAHRGGDRGESGWQPLVSFRCCGNAVCETRLRSASGTVCLLCRRRLTGNKAR